MSSGWPPQMAQAAAGSSTISAPVTVIRPPSPGSGRYAPERVIPGARRALAPFLSPRTIEWHLPKYSPNSTSAPDSNSSDWVLGAPGVTHLRYLVKGTQFMAGEAPATVTSYRVG